MYEEEQPIHELYDDEDYEMQMYNEQFVVDESDDETVTLDSIKRKNRKLWEESKQEIKGFHKITRFFNGKKYEIDVYSTSTTPGFMICDAITGSKCKDYRVGTSKEHGRKCWDNFYFKYMIEYIMIEGNREFNLTYPKINQVFKINCA